MGSTRTPHDAANVVIAPLGETEVERADRVMRLAFGSFLGLPDPLAFMGDAECIRTRWRADPASAFGAAVDGEIVGASIATRWGTVGYFGPLVVDPRLWDRGIGGRLLEPVMACFDAWGSTFAGLCTFPTSAKHHGLYQKFGFWPRFLTAVMSRPVSPESAARLSGAREHAAPHWSGFSELADERRAAILAACRDLTSSIYDGLDVQIEIEALLAQGLGDTVLLWDANDDSRLAGFAVCHCGAGSEAGSGICYIKFGAARPGPGVAGDFDALLDACEAFAATRGLQVLSAGMNTARHEAYRQMLARGFRTQMQEIIMQRHNEPGYNRSGVYLIDDWR